jgi:heptosyltransferase-2
MLGFYRTYTTPFKEKIPAEVEAFFARVSLIKRFQRFFGRYIYAEITLRHSQKIEKISAKHRRILWIQWVDAYLGDSLMDLSSRVLFKDKKIDLLTKENTALIYQNDAIFQRVFTNINACNPNDYDLIIIGSYRQRELKIITHHFRALPHATLFGYYNVDEFHRLYFSFYRLNQLLSYAYNQAYIDAVAKPLLSITKADKAVVGGGSSSYNLPNNYIAIVIGGANEERIFHAWDKVINTLLADKITPKIVLIGLQNAQNAKVIAAEYPDNVIDMVGKCSFNQSAQIIKKSQLLVCVDGGLMHAANAVQTPVVGLFYRLNPSLRLINMNKSYGLVDAENINNISVDDIIKKIKLIRN